jgi:hypothetical protein
MARWIECRSMDGSDPVYVNLDLVATIRPSNVGTVISYGGDDAQVIVSTSIQAILKDEAVVRAQRP